MVPKHMPIHSRRTQHRCDLCGHVFGKHGYLLRHIQSHIGRNSRLVCPVCKQNFTKDTELEEHKRLHKNLNLDGLVNSILPYR